MKRLIRTVCSLVVIALVTASFAVGAQARAVYAETPQVSAKAFCVMDVNTGEVICAGSEHEMLPMASTTKIMTCLLALESGNVGDDVTITKDMLGANGTLLCLEEGWQITLHDLVVGAMVVSGNDAADSIAVTVGGTKENFVSMMNERAAEIGMMNTHFLTPSGLDEKADGGHYSTAYDMCLLAREASKNSDLISITSALESIIYLGNPKGIRYMYTHNYLLEESKSQYSYKGCDGLKTGYTDRAGYCLVTHVQRDGINLVCVTLNAPDRFDDHRKLYDYALSQYSTYHVDASDAQQTLYVVGGEEDTVPLQCSPYDFAVRNEYADDVQVRMSVAPFEYAPIEEGQLVGYLEYITDDVVIMRFPLTAAGSVGATDEPWLSAYVSAIEFRSNGG